MDQPSISFPIAMMGIPFTLRTAADWQKFESQWLAPYACSSVGAQATRRFAENTHEYRTAFQRDRDRIIHSRAFRRLKHKRQVFLITDGDHFRMRLTHTLEVAQMRETDDGLKIACFQAKQIV